MHKYHIKLKKGLGQNFLIDAYALERIVEVADISPRDTVLEIGAGVGHLTRYLARASQRVVAVELDKRLIPPLREVLSPYDNVQIVHGDILNLNPQEFVPEGDYIVVANIPYYITSAIIRHLLEADAKPRRIILTIQREVAQRICAIAGDMSVLALSVQVYGEPYITSRIPSQSFHPAPKVDSASIRIDLYPKPIVPQEKIDPFFKLVKAGFQHKRKTMRNSISAGMGWEKEKTEALLTAAGIDAQRRAQTLSLPEWITILSYYEQT
ncbi:MAG: 16S rRNA (adenine(1518)-N(6)/adenine(1519)-N(6))-dimethyltransferase RsmA [Chloroflexota bacterium]|nr:16S rRNA (adenine(1518)-N(6)/adenine(1519)-N(6))-dimethyltransferase RsmA [Chloroflexota bacterium]